MTVNPFFIQLNFINTMIFQLNYGNMSRKFMKERRIRWLHQCMNWPCN